MTNAEKLALLNGYRNAEGKSGFADFRPARHQSMLDTYIAASQTSVMTEVKLSDLVNVNVEDVAPTAEKLPGYKVLAKGSAKKSTIENPVKFIHDWLNENPDTKRKQAVATLVGLGVNYATARTQYQRWFAGRK